MKDRILCSVEEIMEIKQFVNSVDSESVVLKLKYYDMVGVLKDILNNDKIYSMILTKTDNIG